MMNAIGILALVWSVSATLAGMVVLRRMRREDAEFRSRTVKRQQVLHSELGKLRGEIESIRLRTEEAERTAATAAPRLALTGLQQNRRTQAVRMIRCGEPAESIAQVLGVPKGEIDLLAKVQKLLGVEARAGRGQQPSS